MDYDYFPAALLMEVIIHHVEVHYTIPMEDRHMWPLLLTWFNFNPSMDK